MAASSPKQKIIAKAKNLFGQEAQVDVTMEKVSPEMSRRLHLPNGHWHGECTVNGKVLSSSTHWNKGKAYFGLVRGLEVEFEKSLVRPR